MDKELDKKYGFFTATSMVIGIVIGSGVFFKAEKILEATNGSIITGIAAWIIGGLIMIICANVFASLASYHSKVNGIVDYAEAAIGPTYGYMMAWFTSVIYYPTLASVLAWISARYIGVFFGFNPDSGDTMLIACSLIIVIYAMNSIAPKLAGHFQVATTIIKLIPLLVMAVAGTVRGLSDGQLIDNINYTSPTSDILSFTPLLTAIVASAFAYEGWIVATSINAEIINAKRTLPRALIIGSIIIILVYITYYIGLAGSIDTATLISNGERGIHLAFNRILGSLGSDILLISVIISCLGTLNGLMLGIVRGFYSFAVRGLGPFKRLFREIDPVTNVPNNSAIIGLLLTFLWLLYFYGSNIASIRWFSLFSFDSSELPVITIYAMYIPIFVMIIIGKTGWSFRKRILMPSLAIISSLFMIFAAYISHGSEVLSYLYVYAIIMSIGILLKNVS